MTKKLFLLSGLVVSMWSLSIFAQTAGTAVSIRYGVVKDAQTVGKERRHAGGAVVGGVMGAILSGPRRRPLKIIGSAAAGAAIQSAATSGQLQQYTVNLMDGGVVKVSTEQQEIRIGDCVAVELGQHANIRRVSTFHCETKVKMVSPPPHHQSAADNCLKAKNELASAKTDDEVNNAIKKVRILCED